MYSYSVDKWILLFFVYALAGYIWEICYVSIRSRKFCSRGFLYGPILPIYGFGALIILFAALPLSGSIPLIFLAGMLAATALEYVTGALMLKIFKVRYWDYSKDKGNVKGYICPRASLGWGLFSVLLIKLLHPYVYGAVCLIPRSMESITAHVLALCFAVDCTLSVRNALDLSAVLQELLADENNNGIPDVLEAIPDHIRKKRAAARIRIQRLFDQNPSAVFDKTLDDIVRRIREGR